MNKHAIIPLSLLVLQSIFVSGEESVIDTVSAQGSALQLVIDLIRPFFLKLSVIVGGIFGLYVILIALRVYYERKNTILLQRILYDLDHHNQHYGIPSSRQKVGFFHRFFLDGIFSGHIHNHKPISSTALNLNKSKRKS